MAILNRFSAILLYCDSTRFFASRCGISGDSRPAILGIVRFAIRDESARFSGNDVLSGGYPNGSSSEVWQEPHPPQTRQTYAQTSGKIWPIFNKLKTTPTPNKNGSYSIKLGGFVCHKSRSSYAIKVGSCTTFSVKVPFKDFKGVLRHTTPHFMAYFGVIFFANMEGWGWSELFSNIAAKQREDPHVSAIFLFIQSVR